MGRTAALTIALVAATMSASAQSASPPMPRLDAHSVATRTLMAEELIAASIDTGDLKELRRQRDALLAVVTQARVEPNTEAMHCVLAATRLSGLARQIEPPAKAATLVAARQSYRSYVDDIARCEKATGLARPRKLQPP